MKSNASERTPVTILVELLGRTMYDAEFRERFIKDPRAAFASEGFDFPPELELIAVVDEPNKRHFVVPVFDDSPLLLEEGHPLLRELGIDDKS